VADRREPNRACRREAPSCPRPMPSAMGPDALDPHALRPTRLALDRAIRPSSVVERCADQALRHVRLDPSRHVRLDPQGSAPTAGRRASGCRASADRAKGRQRLAHGRRSSVLAVEYPPIERKAVSVMRLSSIHRSSKCHLDPSRHVASPRSSEGRSAARPWSPAPIVERPGRPAGGELDEPPAAYGLRRRPMSSARLSSASILTPTTYGLRQRPTVIRLDPRRLSAARPWPSITRSVARPPRSSRQRPHSRAHGPRSCGSVIPARLDPRRLSAARPSPSSVEPMRPRPSG
jgi:hypothetical protein